MPAPSSRASRSTGLLLQRQSPPTRTVRELHLSADDFLPLTDGPARRTFGAVGDPASTQPVRHASAGDPPAFLGWGDRDDVVMPRNSEQLAARLKAAGVGVEARLYRGAGHAQTALALVWPFSAKLPVLRESAAFLHAAAERR